MRNERTPDAPRTCGRFTGMSARDRSPTGLEFVSKLFAYMVAATLAPLLVVRFVFEPSVDVRIAMVALVASVATAAIAMRLRIRK